MIVEQLHLKRLKELGINICTKYKKTIKSYKEIQITLK